MSAIRNFFQATGRSKAAAIPPRRLRLLHMLSTCLLVASELVLAQALQCPETPFLRDGFEPPSGASVPPTFGQRAGLDLMNCARQQVNPPANPALQPLAWSTSLATAVQARADSCATEFDVSNGFGQFVVRGFSGANAVPNSVNLVITLRAQYDYAANACTDGGDLCRNYTQVVLRNATTSACAVSAAGACAGALVWCFFDRIQTPARPY